MKGLPLYTLLLSIACIFPSVSAEAFLVGADQLGPQDFVPMVIVHVAVEGVNVVREDLCCAQNVVLRLSVVLQVLEVVIKKVLQDLALILLRLLLRLATRCEDLHEA